MLNTLKKKVAKGFVLRVVIVIAIIIGSLTQSGEVLLAFFKGPVPIEAGMDYEAAEGSYVSFDARIIIDEYVRRTRQSSGSKSQQLKSIGYFVLFEDDGCIFGIEMPASKEEEMDRYLDSTYAWLAEGGQEPSELKHIRGTWTELTGKRLQYYKEQITEDLGAEYLDAALPYFIDTGSIGSLKMSGVYMWSAVLAAALLYLIYITVRYLAGSYKKPIEAYLASHPDVSMDRIEADFGSAGVVGKCIWVGKHWTIYTSGLNARILDHKTLVWAYYYRRTGRYSESSLRVFDTNKTMHTISATKNEAMEVMDLYSKNQAHLVLGYTKELEALFQKDFQGFLNLRFCAGTNEQ